MYQKDFIDESNSIDINGEKIIINNRCYNIIKKLINKKIIEKALKYNFNYEKYIDQEDIIVYKFY